MEPYEISAITQEMRLRPSDSAIIEYFVPILSQLKPDEEVLFELPDFASRARTLNLLYPFLNYIGQKAKYRFSRQGPAMILAKRLALPGEAVEAQPELTEPTFDPAQLMVEDTELMHLIGIPDILAIRMHIRTKTALPREQQDQLLLYVEQVIDELPTAQPRYERPTLSGSVVNHVLGIGSRDEHK